MKRTAHLPTAKSFVQSRWPRACCKWVAGGTHYVYGTMLHGPELGSGPTAGDAWAAAQATIHRQESARLGERDD